MQSRSTLRHGAARWIAILAIAGVLLPTTASADRVVPDYSYWFSYAQTKVYPTTPPPISAFHAQDTTPGVMTLSAARSEYEGRQISLRSSSTLRDIWIQPSDLQATDASGTVHVIPGSEVSTFKVWYVNITHPSYPYKVKGLQPDPLLPMTLANGDRLGWQPDGTMNLALRGVGANTTQPFYVLFHVPDATSPGVYTGTLAITCADDGGNPAPQVTVPVSLTVYPFSIAQRTLKTAFGMDENQARRTNDAAGGWLRKNDSSGHGPAQVTETTTYHADQLGSWYRYMSQHRISPEAATPVWNSPGADGAVSARQDALEDYFGTGTATTLDGDRLAFNAVKMPQYPPSWVSNPFTSASTTSKAARYYRSMYSGLGQYASKAYVYPIDEPNAKQRGFVQKYASFIHRTIPGAKFLLTTDATTQKNKLVRGVDIYVQRLQFFFRDSGWVKKILSAHKTVWIYGHNSFWQGQVPEYMIDGPLVAPRAQGWFAFQTKAAGLLHWSINAWRLPGSSTPRDPYTNPLSAYTKTGKAKVYNNGDGSLVYPGYYPQLGLDVEGAPPVGSLRMESLRDGLEDYEYVKLVAARYGAGTANSFVNHIIGPVPKRKPGKLRFPAYAGTADTYEGVRAGMANLLSQ